MFAIAMVAYWRTAYPTITWWDSSNYTLATSTLGIASAPGSLLLTLLGWPLAHLPLSSSPARTLNLFAGVLAALAAALVYVVALRALRTVARTNQGEEVTTAAIIGAALGACTLAFGDTLWEYAIRFTPYVLSAVFTALILWTMLRWWKDAEQPGAWKRLALLGLLFGLEYSVHRTNALLIPGAAAWILIRRPRTRYDARAWLGGAAGLAAGLAVQFLVIPIAQVTHSPLSFNAPTNLSRFWDYESLRNAGGSFLVQFLPRKADVWTVQTADFLHVLRDNFLNWTGRAGVLGVLPAVAAAFGLAVLWRRDRRLGLAIAVALLLQAAMTVLYFNIPAKYFRPFDRHYLPVCVTIAVLAACGLAVVAHWLASRRMRAVAALAVAVPGVQLANNWTAHDASNRHFARDYAANVLRSLPQRAVYFTVGDNDTFPIMYMQSVEGMRPDVRIVNLSIANLENFAEQTLRREPSFPLPSTSATNAMMRQMIQHRARIDTSLAVPIDATAEQLGLASEAPVPATIGMRVKLTSLQMVPADATLIDIVLTNRWRDPLCFAISGTAESMKWLAPYSRLDGLYWRIVPLTNAPLDAPILAANLARNVYRGFGDPSVPLDDVSRGMGFLYHQAFRAMQDALVDSGDIERCRELTHAFLISVPPHRLGITPADAEAEKERCGGID